MGVQVTPTNEGKQRSDWTVSLYQTMAPKCEPAWESLPRKAVKTGAWAQPTGLLA